jgi:hypothetical protein
MAARYVNPENIAAQGQSFYTGLHPVQYESGGGGGGKNVMGAGSGGSAGVAADRSGADAGRAWNYPGMKFDFGKGGEDKDKDGRGGGQGGTTINVQGGTGGTAIAYGGAGGGGGPAPPDEDGGIPFGLPEPVMPEPDTAPKWGRRPSGVIPGTTTGWPPNPMPGGQRTRDHAAGVGRARADAARDRSEAAQKGVVTKAAKRAEHEESGPSRTYDVTVPGYRPGFDKVKTAAGEPGGSTAPGAMTVQPRAPKPQPGKKSPVVEGTHGMWAETIRNRSSSRSMSRAHA